jgi:PPM family protein phosphatase
VDQGDKQRDERDRAAEASADTAGDQGVATGQESAEPAAENTPAPSEPPPIGVPLAPGDTVEFFEIERLLSDLPNQRVYLAHERAENGNARETARVVLIEWPAGASGDAERIAGLRLRHPRLLAPGLFTRRDKHDYVVSPALVTAEGEPQGSSRDAAPLDHFDTLRAGAGLADALSYLHRNDVAHQRIAPDVIVIHQGRAYLTGLEGGRCVEPGSDESSALAARDANDLALALGALAGVSPDEPEQDNIERENIRRIAAYGRDGSFLSAAEVAGACSAALENTARALPVPPASEMGTGVALTIGAATSVGMVRSQNQDACTAMLLDIYDDQGTGAPLGIFLVADGMGGEAHGEVASRIAARLIPAEMVSAYSLPLVREPAHFGGDAQDGAGGENGDVGAESMARENGAESGQQTTGASAMSADALERALTHAIGAANARIREMVTAIGRASGTTLTALAIHGSQAVLAHIGDSRAYLLRGDVLAQLTEDHSVLARLQAMDHPLLSDPDVFVPRSMLYRSLGQEDEVGADLLELELAPGDRVLLCSDGLWDELDGQTIGSILAAADAPYECARQLVAAANASGGHDNSTAVVVFVQPVPEDAAAAFPRAELDGDLDGDLAGGPLPAAQEPGL